jgi:hypothetical protein
MSTSRLSRRKAHTPDATIQLTDYELYELYCILEKVKASNICIRQDGRELLDSLMHDIQTLNDKEFKIKRCKSCKKVRDA